RVGRELGGGVEESAAAKAVLLGAVCVVDVGVEHRQHARAGIGVFAGAGSVDLQPFLVPGLEVGQHQLLLGGEVVVQAHPRHAGLVGDRVDAGHRYPVGVEEP